MARASKAFQLGLIILQAAFITSCSKPISAASPSSTNTTPAATSVLTVPVPVLAIKPCPYTDMCPEAVPDYMLVLGPINPGIVNPIEISVDQPVSFYLSWPAKDNVTLATNMLYLQFFVAIDGQRYWDDAYMGAPEPFEFSDQPGVQYSAQYVGVAVSGWKVGEPHQIRIGFFVTGDINNGWNTFAKGTTIEYVYQVNPIQSVTITAVPSATAPTIQQANQGGVIIANGSSQVILYGQRAGTDTANAYVVDGEGLDEVTAQQPVQETLRGNGPPLFAYFENQPFTSTSGETALANMSIGSTNDPNIYIGFLWSSEIDGALPAAEVSNLQKESFSVNGEQTVSFNGWLEYGQIWTSNTAEQAENQQEGFSFFLFHHDQEVYLLGFLPGYNASVPQDDFNSANLVKVHSGQGYSYAIRGYLGGSVSMPLGGLIGVQVPILQVYELERLN